MNTRISQALKKASTGVLNESLKLNRKGDTLYYGKSSVSLDTNFFGVHASFINLEETDEFKKFTQLKNRYCKLSNTKFASHLLYIAKNINNLDEKFLDSLKFINTSKLYFDAFVIKDEALVVLLKTLDLLLDKSFKAKKEPSKALSHVEYVPGNTTVTKTAKDLLVAEISIFLLKKELNQGV